MALDMLNRAYDSYFKSTKPSTAEEAFFKNNFNTLDAFIQSHDVDYAKTPANDSIVKNAESKLGVKFGPQLYKYLTQYGYLGYDYVEFHGITKQQGLNSDMVKDTLKVHKLSQDTRNMVVIENQGEGDYFLVDGKDKVYEFDINMGKVVPTKYSLFRYIEYRFNLAASGKKEPATEALFKKNKMQWRHVSPLKNSSSISMVEKTYGYTLPSDFKSCVMQNNGGTPSKYILKRPENEYVFSGLMSFNKDDTDNVYNAIKLFAKNGTLKVFPFGMDPFGNYYCFDRGKVVHYDHETDRSKVVAKSFTDFIRGLSNDKASRVPNAILLGTAAASAINQNRINNQMMMDQMMQEHQRFVRQTEMDNFVRSQNQFMMNQMMHF